MVTTPQTILKGANLYNLLACFLKKSGPDAHGRYLQDILKFTDEELEECHDQIQWSFPLHEESNFAIIYPIIDEEFIIKYNNKIIQKKYA